VSESLKNHNIRRVFIEAPKNSIFHVGKSYLLSDEKRQHLKKVLRLEWNEPLIVTDGAGSFYEAKLVQVDNKAHVEISSLIEKKEERKKITLFVALAKNSTMDWVVEKAVECGVDEIVPFVSARSIVRPDSKERFKYKTRWQSIADEALEQSEQSFRTQVFEPQFWDETQRFIDKNLETSVKVLFSTEFLRKEKKGQPKEIYKELDEALKLAQSQRSVAIILGAEGGFTSEELEIFEKKNFQFVALGASILRVETAVTVASFLFRKALSS
jgi:16S rRNA (uracil1498-N3)-methyltransferase